MATLVIEITDPDVINAIKARYTANDGSPLDVAIEGFRISNPDAYVIYEDYADLFDCCEQEGTDVCKHGPYVIG